MKHIIEEVRNLKSQLTCQHDTVLQLAQKSEHYLVSLQSLHYVSNTIAFCRKTAMRRSSSSLTYCRIARAFVLKMWETWETSQLTMLSTVQEATRPQLHLCLSHWMRFRHPKYLALSLLKHLCYSLADQKSC